VVQEHLYLDLTSELVSDLLFVQQFLLYDFERADEPGVFLLRQEDASVFAVA
jgi:hypothetical protein